MRRHRAATQAAASLALVAVVSLSAALLIDQARGRVRRALDQVRMALDAETRAQAETQRARQRVRLALDAETRAQAEAQANFLQARKTVDDYLTLVSASVELRRDLHGMQALDPFPR